MSYISIDGGAYGDYYGSTALNLIISDYSTDVTRVFGYVDSDGSATWAFDINPPNYNYDDLYYGCSSVKTSKYNGNSFSPGATYKITAKGYNSSGSMVCSDYVYVTVPQPSCPEPYSVDIGENDTYFSAYVDYDYDYSVSVYYQINSGTWYSGGDVAKSSLNDGDTVRFRARCTRSGYVSSSYVYSSYSTFYKPVCPEPSDVYIQNDGYYYYVTYYVPSGYTAYSIYSLDGGVTFPYVGENVSMSSLAEGTKVMFAVRTERSGYKTSVYVKTAVITHYNRPPNFTAFTMKVGDTIPTETVGSSIYAYIVPATTWNSFTTRINDFRKYKKLSNYAFTTVSRGSNFYGGVFNEAVFAIGDMSSTNPVWSGDDIKASYFTNLQTILNSIN